jgi:hypothetical protein
MGKASESHQMDMVHVVLEMVEDGQRLEFDVGPGTERRKIRFEIGHVQGYGELFIERFEPLNDMDELDLRVKLIVPPGAGDRPAAGGPTIVGTARHLAQLTNEQRAKAVNLPKGEDGEAFLTEESQSASTDAPGAPTPEELGTTAAQRIETLVATEVPLSDGLSTISMERQLTAPGAEEETELMKLARAESSMPTVIVPPEPTTEEVAEMVNTTPPTPNEEKELEAKARKKNSGLGGRLR